MTAVRSKWLPLAAAKFGQLVVGLVSAGVAAWALPLSDLAVWFVFLATSALVAGIAELGSIQHLIRGIASESDIAGSCGATVRILSAAGLSVAAFLVLLGVSAELLDIGGAKFEWERLTLLWCAVVLQLGQRICFAVEVGSGRPLGGVFLDGLGARTVHLSLVVVAGLMVQHSFTTFAVLHLVSVALVSGAFTSLRRWHRQIMVVLTVAPVFRLRHTIRLGLARTLSLFQAVGDVILVAVVLDDQAVVVYSLSWRLAVLVSVPQQAINTVAPKVLRSAYLSGGFEAASALSRKLAYISLLPAILIFFCIVPAGPYVFAALVGPDVESAFVTVLALGTGQIIVVALGPVGGLLVACDRDLHFLIGTCLGGAVLIVGTLGGGLVWGLPGAALGSVLAVVLTNVSWSAAPWAKGFRADGVKLRRPTSPVGVFEEME